MKIMKKSSIVISQILVVFIGLIVLSFLLWEPHIEGRNAEATFFQIYFNDLFLAYVYISSIPFFAGLIQVFKVLGYIRQGKTFSPITIEALQTIKYCAIAIVIFVLVSVVFIFSMSAERDGPVDLIARIIVLFGSVLVALLADKFQRKIIQNIAEMRPEGC